MLDISDGCGVNRNVVGFRTVNRMPGIRSGSYLTTQKTLYVEISRARERSELVTDDRDGLRERMEAATGL